jgi:hypothetical protein
VVTIALIVLLLAWLPGALLYRLPYADRAQRAAVPAEERLFWAVLLSVTWSVGLALLLAAFGLYTLPRVLWTTGVFCVLLVVAARGRLRYAERAVRPGWTALVPVGLTLLGAALFFPSFEYIMGGKDPGVYISEGIQISRTGDLFIDDPTVTAVPAEARSLFFRDPTDQSSYSVRFMGFFLESPQANRVFAQFPHWFPASIALAYDAGGLTAARGIVGAWAILGLLAVYFAGARLFGALAAAIATTLLAIHVLEIWFGRYPNAELASQSMLFGGLLAFRRTLDGGRVFFGTIAALLIGLPLFVRFDALLTVGAVVGAVALLSVSRQRVGWTFAVVLAAVTALGVWYLAGPMWHYSATYVGTVRYSNGWWMLLAIGGATVGFVAAMRVPRWRAIADRWVPRVLAVALVGLAIYGYFFREPAPRLPVENAYALRNFRWYLTGPGILLAVIGMAAMILRRFWRDPAFFLTVSVYAVLTFYKPRIIPEHFWAGRRFITVILPAALLVMSALVVWVLNPDRLARLFSRSPGRPKASWKLRTASTMVAIAALAPLGWTFWLQSAPVRAHVEYAGLQSEIERLVATVGPKDLLLVEARDADSDLHVLALPYSYIYGRPALVLNSWAPDKRALEAFLKQARTRYDNVYFLGGGGTDLLTRDLDAELVARRRVQVPEYASTFNAYPTGVRQKEFDLGIYRLRLAGEATAGRIDLQIGGQDDLQVARFFAREQRGDGSTFRWTKGRSYVMLRGAAPAARDLIIWMSSGGRPQSVPPAEVRVAIGDHWLGTVTLADEMRPYRFEIPAAVAAEAARTGDPLRVRIEVATWNPNRVHGAPDTRDLGVMVTRVQLQ